MRLLLREVIRSLLERARDSEYKQIATRAYDALLQAVDGRSVDEIGMRVSTYKNGTVFVYATFEELGVDLPASLAGLTFGVHIGKNNDDDDIDGPTTAVADGTSISPGKLPFMPAGGIVIGFNDDETKTSHDDVERELRFGHPSIGTKRARRKLASRAFSIDSPKDIDVSHLLRVRRAVFVHEMVHQLDANHRPDAASMSQHMRSQLKAGKYYDTEHEQNAYFIQGFEDIVQTFEEEYPYPTQARAAEFVHDAEHLWKRFEEHVSNDIKNHFSSRRSGSERVPRYNDPKQKWMYVPKRVQTPDAMRRKFVARLTSMWDDYVASLPSG